MLGLCTPDPISPTAEAIAQAWRDRWLNSRVLRQETLDELAQLGPDSIRASLHVDVEIGQLDLPADEGVFPFAEVESASATEHEVLTVATAQKAKGEHGRLLALRAVACCRIQGAHNVRT